MRMQGYCDVYKWTILKRTSPEVKCLHPTSSRREMCTLSVSSVINHKFSHGAAFYTLNGENVNVILEMALTVAYTFIVHFTSSMREMCTLSVSNMIYHKFSHGAAFYTLNGNNVNVMLELALTVAYTFIVHFILSAGIIFTVSFTFTYTEVALNYIG